MRIWFKSRCVCVWKGKKNARVHCQTANGKIVYVDPQTEDRVNIDRRLNLTAKGMTEISRQVYAYENIEFSESKIPNDFHALHCVNI